MKAKTSYITLQACVAITFIFVVIMTFKFSSVKVQDSKISSMAPIFDVKPPRLKVDRPKKVPKQPFDYILENQRLRIDTEMDQFPFENNQELSNLIPEMGGQPKRAMVTNHFIVQFSVSYKGFFFPDCHNLAKWFHVFGRYFAFTSCHILSLWASDKLPDSSNSRWFFSFKGCPSLGFAL